MRYSTFVQGHVFKKMLAATLMAYSSTLMATVAVPFNLAKPKLTTTTATTTATPTNTPTTTQVPSPTTTTAAMPTTASIEADMAELQALVVAYINQLSAVDALNAAYSSYGQAYTLDSPSITPTVADEGTGGDTAWTPLTFTDVSAASALGYASNLCAVQPVSTVLTTVGVTMESQKFEAVKTSFCKLVQTAAHLKNRYDKYQSIKTNGIALVNKHKKQTNRYAGHTRTVQGWIELRYFPDIANTATNGGVPDLQYNSYFQWSDDSKNRLNIIQSLRTLTSSGKGCEGFPIPITDRIKLYTNVVSSSSSSVTIENCISGRAYGETKTLTLPKYTIPAPFGYMAELESMKDNAKSDLLNKMQSKVTDMVTQNEKIKALVTKIQTAQTALAKMPSNK